MTYGVDRYVYCYGMTIVSQIKDETSGNYGQFLCAMVTDKPKFDACQIHKAIRGWGTDEDRKIVILFSNCRAVRLAILKSIAIAVLTEICCTRTNTELKRIKQACKIVTRSRFAVLSVPVSLT